MKVKREFKQRLIIWDVPNHIFWFMVKHCDIALSATPLPDREIMIHRWQNTHNEILQIKKGLPSLKDQEYLVELSIETYRHAIPVNELRIFPVTAVCDWSVAKNYETYADFAEDLGLES